MLTLLIFDCDLTLWGLISDVPDMQCDAHSVQQVTYLVTYLLTLWCRTATIVAAQWAL
jgi:hypothetical protein